jgi:formylglycine-generating enzyme required for sulfatase activity/serine/threonine protein kinase
LFLPEDDLMNNEPQLGKYILREQLGRGGFGTVYRAHDTVLEVERAVKVLHPALTADPEFVERFRREARLAAKLEHANIVPVYDLDEQAGHYFLAMRYMPGGSLKTMLDQQGALSFERALAILKQIASGLDYAHAQGLLHRDIKPQNILFDRDGNACLSDLGFAKVLTASGTSASFSRSGVMVGTPAYMSPEAWDGEGWTPAADVYSLGCVFYEMLTGKLLFNGESPSKLMKQHIIEGPGFPEKWPEGVPQEVRGVLEKALAKEPKERYAGAGKLAAALEELSVETGDPQLLIAEKKEPEIFVEKPTAEPALITERAGREDKEKTPAPLLAPPEPKKYLWRPWAAGLGGLLLVACIVIAALALPGLIARPASSPTPTIRFLSTYPLMPTDTPTITLAPTETPTSTPSGPYPYVVQEGDSLFSIIKTNNLGENGLILIYMLNPNIDPATGQMTVGQTIILPPPGMAVPTSTPIPNDLEPGSRITYLVMPGDSLGSIANKLFSTIDAILAANQTTLKNGVTSIIYPGERLMVPINLVTPVPTKAATFTPSSISTLRSGATQVSTKDGMVMIYVPAGEFLMGSTDSDTKAQRNEKPQHSVFLDAYWIYGTEVTNTMFESFVNQTSYQTEAEKSGSAYVFNFGDVNWNLTQGANWNHPQGPNSSLSNLGLHPVVDVSWNDAQAYCHWVEARLPTEAEWEKAARGTDGRTNPWGNQPPAGNLLNFADVNLPVSWADKNINDGYEFTAPVGSYPAGKSPYGVLDMAGNVWNWLNDWYSDTYYESSPSSNPQGPSSGTTRVIRGSAWYFNISDVRSAFRYGNLPDTSHDNVGFRCARSQ